MQQYPLLQTKLYIPPIRPGLVLRPRLIERLQEGLELGCKLTLVCAPAEQLAPLPDPEFTGRCVSWRMS